MAALPEPELIPRLLTQMIDYIYPGDKTVESVGIRDNRHHCAVKDLYQFIQFEIQGAQCGIQMTYLDHGSITNEVEY